MKHLANKLINNCMQQLHATITCNNYMQQLHATITCNNYMQQLQAKFTCMPVYIYITDNYLIFYESKAFGRTFYLFF